MQTVANFLTFFSSFIHAWGALQLVLAVVVALFFGFAAKRLAGAMFLPVMAAVVFLAADCVLPAVLHHAPIAVPAFDMTLLGKWVALYVFFLVASGLVFGIKRAGLAFRH
jgi:hypothetical protein